MKNDPPFPGGYRCCLKNRTILFKTAVFSPQGLLLTPLLSDSIERALAGHKKERMQPHPPIFQILQTFSGLLRESWRIEANDSCEACEKSHRRRLRFT